MQLSVVVAGITAILHAAINGLWRVFKLDKANSVGSGNFPPFSSSCVNLKLTKVLAANKNIYGSITFQVLLQSVL